MAELVFENIGKRFGDGPKVLQGLSARLPLEGLSFVVGKTGSGKSVLCRLAVGLLKPDEGSVTLDGEPIHALPERALSGVRRRYPYLVQGPALLDWLTLRENVALPDRAALSDGRADEALKQVGLTELASRYPPEVGPALKKRTAIARALVLKPRCLLLDEPTTGLDREAAGLVNDSLARLKELGLGAIVVSHDYSALERLADRVLEVKEGVAGYQGPPANFLSSQHN